MLIIFSKFLTKSQKIGIAFLGVAGLFGLYIGYIFGKRAFLKYQAGRDRSYNVFDKA